MDIMDRFKLGISAASDSFRFIWQHKILLSYLGVVTAIKMILTIITTSYSLHKYAGILYLITVHIPLYFLLIPITLFAQVALTHHTAHFFDQTPTSIYKTIRATLCKWQAILAWSCITIVSNLLFGQLTHIHYLSPLDMSLGLLGVAWALVTIFVPTSIALEQLSLYEHLQHSIIVMRNYLFKLLGGLLWFGIVFLLCAIPFGGAWILASFAPNLYYSIIFLQTISCLELIIQWIISSACTTFKALLYLQYKQGLEELQQLQYPRL